MRAGSHEVVGFAVREGTARPALVVAAGRSGTVVVVAPTESRHRLAWHLARLTLGALDELGPLLAREGVPHAILDLAAEYPTTRHAFGAVVTTGQPIVVILGDHPFDSVDALLPLLPQGSRRLALVHAMAPEVLSVSAEGFPTVWQVRRSMLRLGVGLSAALAVFVLMAVAGWFFGSHSSARPPAPPLPPGPAQVWVVDGPTVTHAEDAGFLCPDCQDAKWAILPVGVAGLARAAALRAVGVEPPPQPYVLEVSAGGRLGARVVQPPPGNPPSGVSPWGAPPADPMLAAALDHLAVNWPRCGTAARGGHDELTDVTRDWLEGRAIPNETRQWVAGAAVQCEVQRLCAPYGTSVVIDGDIGQDTRRALEDCAAKDENAKALQASLTRLDWARANLSRLGERLIVTMGE